MNIPHIFQFGISTRTRKSPYFDATIADGVQGMTTYNHMLMPTWYDSPLADYWHLVENVTMWDVAVERQVEITGPDAMKLATLMTPRNISKMRVGQCKYVPIVDENGGMLNDPILLRLGENHFWLSLADSDLLLWAKGLAYGLGLDVNLVEPDVSPLAIQGPNWLPVCRNLLGDWVADLRFFRFREFELDGIPLVVARSGWSKQGGLELYLRDGSRANELWERVKKAGETWNIRPATPSTIERIESGLLSYGNDMTINDNPFQVGLGQYCDVHQEANFIGKTALQKIKCQGVKRKLVGVFLDCEERMFSEHWWPIYREGERIGDVRSATWSPHLKRNIALAMVHIHSAEINTQFSAETPWGIVDCQVTTLPFVDHQAR